MRISYLIIALLTSSILFLSNTPKKGALSEIFLLDDSGEPQLPEIPFDYEGLEVPSHLLSTTNGWADANALEDISNEVVTLGRVLFYDELLSANENLSCATCHLQHLSFADDTPYSEGVSELTKRNSPHLNDLGWSNNAAFFWDLREESLEQMITVPLLNENELGVTDWNSLALKLNQSSYYPSLMEEAYGDQEISIRRIQIALGQFIRSMTTFDSKFDKVQRGEAYFSAQQALGFDLFKANCQVCHIDGKSRLMEDYAYPDNILSAGTMFNNRKDWGDDPGAGVWKWYMEGNFKVPTLRNVELTAPYMHDGRFANLREVINHYSSEADIGGADWSLVPLGGFHFSEKERYALEAFLKTFTDKNITENEKWSDPFGNTTTATEELSPILAAEVYPNPGNGLTYITFDNESHRKVMAYLINVNGEIIRKLSTHKNGFVTDVSMLSAGTYILKIRDGETFIDKKLIVQ